MQLNRYYFDNEDESYYVYAYTPESATEYFKDNKGDISSYVMTLDGVSELPTTDEFFDKYETISYMDDDYDFMHDKHDFWKLAQEMHSRNPGCVWSFYTSGEIICGIHTIDVLGFYFTTKPGQIDEAYGYYEGLVD